MEVEISEFVFLCKGFTARKELLGDIINLVKGECGNELILRLANSYLKIMCNLLIYADCLSPPVEDMKNFVSVADKIPIVDIDEVHRRFKLSGKPQACSMNSDVAAPNQQALEICEAVVLGSEGVLLEEVRSNINAGLCLLMRRCCQTLVALAHVDLFSSASPKWALALAIAYLQVTGAIRMTDMYLVNDSTIHPFRYFLGNFTAMYGPPRSWLLGTLEPYPYENALRTLVKLEANNPYLRCAYGYQLALHRQKTNLHLL